MDANALFQNGQDLSDLEVGSGHYVVESKLLKVDFFEPKSP